MLSKITRFLDNALDRRLYKKIGYALNSADGSINVRVDDLEYVWNNLRHLHSKRGGPVQICKRYIMKMHYTPNDLFAVITRLTNSVTENTELASRDFAIIPEETSYDNWFYNNRELRIDPAETLDELDGLLAAFFQAYEIARQKDSVHIYEYRVSIAYPMMSDIYSLCEVLYAELNELADKSTAKIG